MFVPLERQMNTLQSMYKLCHFNLTMSPLYLVKLKIAQNSRPLTAVQSVEQIVTTFRRKSFNVPLFFCLLKNSFSCLLTKNIYIQMGFLLKIYFHLNMVNFNT